MGVPERLPRSCGRPQEVAPVPVFSRTSYAFVEFRSTRDAEDAYMAYTTTCVSPKAQTLKSIPLTATRRDVQARKEPRWTPPEHSCL